jgi:UDP-glucose 4-epimerase
VVFGGYFELKVLLIGGLGFVGRHLIRFLSGSCDLAVFSDPIAAETYQSFSEAKGLRVIVGDITEGEAVRQLFATERPDAVVHLAALTGLAKCNENPSLAFSINVLGTYNIVMGCLTSRSKLIFVSSREVYGDSVTDQTSEDGPLLPNNVYGLTKFLGEKLVLWAASRHALDYTILRLTNVYGPEGDQYNIQAMISSAMSRGMIPIMGGNQRMNLIYVEDVAEAIAMCLKNPMSSKQTFNVGSGNDVTIEDLVTQLISELGMPVNIERHPMRSGETVSFKPNLSKIENVLGFKARTQLNDGLRRTVKWYADRDRAPR